MCPRGSMALCSTRTITSTSPSGRQMRKCPGRLTGFPGVRERLCAGCLVRDRLVRGRRAEILRAPLSIDTQSISSDNQYMSSKTPRPLNVITIVTWMALGALAVVIVVGGVLLFPVSASLARDNPEFADLQTPLLALALAIGVCAEAVLAVTAVLVGFIHQDRIFDRAAARTVDLLVLTVVAATVLTAFLLPFIPGPPPLALLIFGGVLLGITLSLVLSVLRLLLRRAVLIRAELAEVV